jgi:DNA-binding GntR family transcriptional regulator
VAELNRVARTLLRERAYRALQEAIVSGVLAPGQVIRDVDLAEQLGLSRAPVREALARLAEEGLVEFKPQSYTRVTPLVAKDVRDALAVIRAMHELAAQEAVPVLTEEHFAMMRAAGDRFAEAVRAGDVDGALAADDELHDVPVHACGNGALAATIHRYTPLIRRLERRRFAAASGRRSVRLHDRLIAAFAARDVTAAVRVTREIWAGLADLIETEPDTEPDTEPRSEVGSRIPPRAESRTAAGRPSEPSPFPALPPSPGGHRAH